jgi:hypothetical protein
VRENASAQLTALGSLAAQPLKDALSHPDLEVQRRAEDCLRQIHIDSVAFAATRLVAQRKPAGAAEVLLAYLPVAEGESVGEEVRSALAAVAVRDGKADPALAAALADGKSALRRGAAAEALAKAGTADQLPAVRALLKDPDPAVRLRVGLALAPLKEKEAVAALIDLLAELPPEQLWKVEDLLYFLAEDKAPRLPPGDDAESRRKVRDAWAAWWKEHGAGVDLGRLAKRPPVLGHTLVVLLDAKKVIDLDAANKPRFQITDLEFPLDAQALPGDRVLVAEHGANRVTERTRDGKVVWQKDAEEPLAAQRLPGGNTFIATRTRLLEVDAAGKEVFSHSPPPGELIMKAQKLPNGDIACVTSGQRFLRLDARGKELLRFPVAVQTYGGKIDVLPSGRVLVPLMSSNKVVEYDVQGRPVWEVPVEQPIAAVRLPNGNTLVTTYNQFRAVELDPRGRQVWQYETNTRVTRAFRR